MCSCRVYIAPRGCDGPINARGGGEGHIAIPDVNQRASESEAMAPENSSPPIGTQVRADRAAGVPQGRGVWAEPGKTRGRGAATPRSCKKGDKDGPPFALRWCFRGALFLSFGLLCDRRILLFQDAVLDAVCLATGRAGWSRRAKRRLFGRCCLSSARARGAGRGRLYKLGGLVIQRRGRILCSALVPRCSDELPRTSEAGPPFQLRGEGMRRRHHRGSSGTMAPFGIGHGVAAEVPRGFLRSRENLRDLSAVPKPAERRRRWWPGRRGGCAPVGQANIVIGQRPRCGGLFVAASQSGRRCIAAYCIFRGRAPARRRRIDGPISPGTAPGTASHYSRSATRWPENSVISRLTFCTPPNYKIINTHNHNTRSTIRTSIKNRPPSLYLAP